MRPDRIQVAKSRIFVVIFRDSLIELLSMPIFIKCNAFKVLGLKLP